jgi:signal transduction histidine kinase
VQEALHNVARHSQAKSVNVQVSRQGSDVLLLVEDDGVGLSKANTHERRTFGLEGIRERIAMLGGLAKITSVRDKGTRLEIRVPAERSGLETLFPAAGMEIAAADEPLKVANARPS